MTKRVVIDYTNYRGERALRVIEPVEVGWFEVDQYHKGPQWLLRAFDVDRQAERRFAMKDIRSWRPACGGCNGERYVDGNQCRICKATGVEK